MTERPPEGMKVVAHRPFGAPDTGTVVPREEWSHPNELTPDSFVVEFGDRRARYTLDDVVSVGDVVHLKRECRSDREDSGGQSDGGRTPSGAAATVSPADAPVQARKGTFVFPENSRDLFALFLDDDIAAARQQALQRIANDATMTPLAKAASRAVVTVKAITVQANRDQAQKLREQAKQKNQNRQGNR